MKKDGKVHHAEIELGDSCVMLSDEHPDIQAYAPPHYGGSPITLQLYTEDCDAMYKRALAAGAESVREPADQFYGDRTAGVKDPFGYTWWLSTHIKDVSKEELERGS
jgi:PhnB protein